VNITCGLSIIQVSVDHGTVFGKAEDGKTDPESMIQAIKIAAKLAVSK
jgi:4-hydroxy-L-threonine phosphate dehydrogenase PdxA